jgi:hypothetical protein
MNNEADEEMTNKLLSSSSRSTKKEEIDRLQIAVNGLKKKKFISEENSFMLSDFLNSGKLKFVS